MSIIKHREARQLPCPTCGQSCSEDFVLRYLEGNAMPRDFLDIASRLRERRARLGSSPEQLLHFMHNISPLLKEAEEALTVLQPRVTK